jgi:hypothetical protein
MRVSVLLLLLVGCAAPPPPDDREAPYAGLLKGATTLRVRSGGLCHRILEDERTLLTMKDPAEVRKVADCLRIVPRQGEVIRCRCCGDPTLEFFRGDELVVAVGLHHGLLIRSKMIGDEELAAASAQDLCRWLADRGIPEPEASRKRSRLR